MKRKVCVVTGTRAEYGLLKPVMEAVSQHPNLDLQLIVAGMHLSKEFGYTKNEIERDGFKIYEEVSMHPAKDSGKYMAKAIGNGIKRMTDKLDILNPDILVILGDRIEALAAAIAAAYMNIPIAHIHGGDKSRAGLDESIRHSLTKLAYIHLTATRKSAQRILKMGEDKWRIFVVGSPGINNIKKQRLLNCLLIHQRFGIDPVTDKYLVLLQHSVTTQSDEAASQIKKTIQAIKKSKLKTVIIYPNSDAGGRDIIKEISKLRTDLQFTIFKNLNNQEFYSLIAHASALVGNSSCGIIEAPYFGIPFVNIGIRQEGRERAGNVIDVPHDSNSIYKAIMRAVSQGHFLRLKNPYSIKDTDKKIANILSKIPLRKDLIQKTITY